MEIWKSIDNFEAYEVSNLGRVRRILPGPRTHIGRHLKLITDHKGYTAVYLWKNGKSYGRKVHRLVAVAFISNPLNLPQVNHKGKKEDNRACKLEWISTKDHGRDRAKRGQSNGDGVCLIRTTEKNKRKKNVWVARYCPEPKRVINIGYFNTRKEAKAARDAKLKTL